ncbi:chromate resistance protein [Chromobacterium haemolyticum]|uniref:chromate resistance protein ChrB domain-containing protein n=1 Tax=Chromobacterium haemolyticum TaxID=394935 RepID=UPI0009DB0486|nr:chromate resistance protein ChrB domain-containing protein [Chromobacterium haemolyticum]OQS33327.1 chromate resistance protein [Chromobacterium haemolyticum]
MDWLLLITSLPTENATARMRAWRALKACGSAALRDGAYLLPVGDARLQQLEAIASDIQQHCGVARLLTCRPLDGSHFPPLFQRDADYQQLRQDIQEQLLGLDPDNAAERLKQWRRLGKALAGIAAIDFFPSAGQEQAQAALQQLEAAIQQQLSPGEPHSLEMRIPRRALAEHQGRTWATRRRPWVDRLASAWLIRRFIDPQARILWLAAPGDCPPDALGFDFDGAAFTHIGDKVSFEVLLASFELDSPPLRRLAALVHYLDVGGAPPPEASGVETVLAGLRAALSDDDQLLAAASNIWDGLYQQFAKEA